MSDGRQTVRLFRFISSLQTAEALGNLGPQPVGCCNESQTTIAVLCCWLLTADFYKVKNASTYY